jgi:hypothetical protein
MSRLTELYEEERRILQFNVPRRKKVGLKMICSSFTNVSRWRFWLAYFARIGNGSSEREGHLVLALLLLRTAFRFVYMVSDDERKMPRW